ncbi:MAG: hypothetical protein ABI675_24355 [Chitinophagaceae bacterium]
MEKYLFTDGTNAVREVQSGEELQTLIQSSVDPGRIRIWVFSSNEWVTYAEFSKQSVAKIVPLKKTASQEEEKKVVTTVSKPTRKYAGLIKLFIVFIAGLSIFLVYNFTRVKWKKSTPVEITALRPANVPLLDVDSLIQFIEYTRGQKLDRVTSTNLRIRNTWPDRIQLQLKSDRDTSQAGNRFYNINITIDNSTGYNIDNVVVEFKNWINGQVSKADTIRFENVGYAAPAARNVTGEWKSDSLSVSFLSLRSKAFNFCYAAGKESNYGNLNDRWFCKE